MFKQFRLSCVHLLEIVYRHLHFISVHQSFPDVRCEVESEPLSACNRPPKHVAKELEPIELKQAIGVGIERVALGKFAVVGKVIAGRNEDAQHW